MKKFSKKCNLNYLKNSNKYIEKTNINLKTTNLNQIRFIADNLETKIKINALFRKNMMIFALLGCSAGLTTYYFYLRKMENTQIKIAEELKMDITRIQHPLEQFKKAYIKENGDLPPNDPRKWLLKKESLYLLSNFEKNFFSSLIPNKFF